MQISVCHLHTQIKRQKVSQMHLRGSSLRTRACLSPSASSTTYRGSRPPPNKGSHLLGGEPSSRNTRQRGISGLKETLPIPAPHSVHEAEAGLLARAPFQGLRKKETIIKMTKEWAFVPTLQTTTSQLVRPDVATPSDGSDTEVGGEALVTLAVCFTFLESNHNDFFFPKRKTQGQKPN